MFLLNLVVPCQSPVLLRWHKGREQNQPCISPASISPEVRPSKDRHGCVMWGWALWLSACSTAYRLEFRPSATVLFVASVKTCLWPQCGRGRDSCILGSHCNPFNSSRVNERPCLKIIKWKSDLENMLSTSGLEKCPQASIHTHTPHKDVSIHDHITTYSA